MKLWSAKFIINTGYRNHKYELIISAPDLTAARNQVYAVDNNYCDCEDNIDFSTLIIDEINLNNVKVLKAFDRGVIK